MGVSDERFVRREQKISRIENASRVCVCVCVDCACAADRRADRACALINGHAQ